MQNHRTTTKRRRSGAAVTELAICLALLLLLVFGIIEIGSMFFVQHNMYQAGREAARYMAVQEATPAEAETLANNILAPLGMTFNVTATNSPPDAIVTITVDKDEASFGDPLQIFGAGNLTAQVTMRIEN